jgi:hypothetical protein
MGAGNKYPDFDYVATELSAYTVSVGVFIISLKNTNVSHFTPGDVEAFEKWLIKHQINIRKIRVNTKL